MGINLHIWYLQTEAQISYLAVERGRSGRGSRWSRSPQGRRWSPTRWRWGWPRCWRGSRTPPPRCIAFPLLIAAFSPLTKVVSFRNNVVFSFSNTMVKFSWSWLHLVWMSGDTLKKRSLAPLVCSQPFDKQVILASSSLATNSSAHINTNPITWESGD